MKRMTTLSLVALLFATTASAQELSAGSILKSVALDPTTYAPAAIYRQSLKSDWDSSQPLFALGYVEANGMFTQSGRAFSAPLSHEAGNAKIDKLALRLAVDSVVHNLASNTLERMLIKAHPEKKRLIKTLGIIERIAVGSYLAYVNSAKHFKQAGINERMLAGAR